MEEVAFDNLKIFMLLEPIYLGVVAHEFYFDGVVIYSDTVAFLGKLDHVSTNASKGIENVDPFVHPLHLLLVHFLLIVSLLERVLHSLGEMLSERLRCDRVPSFFIDLDTPIKLAEEKVSTPVELLDVFRLHLVGQLVELKYFCLAALGYIVFRLLLVIVAKLILVLD